MFNPDFYYSFLHFWLALALVVFIVLFFQSAPYGRYADQAPGPRISNKWGWLIMEAPSSLCMAFFFFTGRFYDAPAAVALLVIWQMHYVHRAFLYPFTIKGGKKEMPVMIIVFGMIFNSINAYINGAYLSFFSGGYGNEWLTDPRFLIGSFTFIVGFALNRRSDAILRRLRKKGENDYKIPHGGMHRWISCPNYFGEIILWAGWAVATWSLAGLSFAVWTAANLIPRAWAHHKWYQEKFPDYPRNRKAILPGLF